MGLSRLFQTQHLLLSLAQGPTHVLAADTAGSQWDNHCLDMFNSSALSLSFDWITALVEVTDFTTNGLLNEWSSLNRGSVFSITKFPTHNSISLLLWSYYFFCSFCFLPIFYLATLQACFSSLANSSSHSVSIIGYLAIGN